MGEMLETTDWNVFSESCDDLNELAGVVSSYVGFVYTIEAKGPNRCDETITPR